MVDFTLRPLYSLGKSPIATGQEAPLVLTPKGAEFCPQSVHLQDSYDSQKQQQLISSTDWSLQWRRSLFHVRYELNV
jgi:hypothetical protein